MLFKLLLYPCYLVREGFSSHCSLSVRLFSSSSSLLIIISSIVSTSGHRLSVFIHYLRTALLSQQFSFRKKETNKQTATTKTLNCGSFIKFFNQYLPAPTCSHPTWLHAVRGAPEGSGGVTESAQRVTDATWRLILNDAPASKKPAPVAPVQETHSITIGRIQVSTQDRWRIQANMRKEGEKKGLNRTEYNKAVTRAVINVKGPTGGPGFPPGRGRPTLPTSDTVGNVHYLMSGYRSSTPSGAVGRALSTGSHGPTAAAPPPVQKSSDINSVAIEVSDSEEDSSTEISPHVVDLLNRASQAIKEERGKALTLRKEVEEMKRHLCAMLFLFAEEKNTPAAGHTKLFKYLSTQASSIGSLCGMSIPADDARSSNEAGQNSKPALSSRSGSRAPSTPTRAASHPKEEGGGRSTAPLATAPPKAATVASAPPPSHEVGISAAEAGMIARLRRAMAPPPSKAQVSDVVDAMVGELRKEIDQKLADHTLRWPPVQQRDDLRSIYHLYPWTIQVEKEGPCAYRFLYGPEAQVRSVLEGRRKCPGASIDALLSRCVSEKDQRNSRLRVKHFLVNLTIDSGSLNVVCGGGHVNLLHLDIDLPLFHIVVAMISCSYYFMAAPANKWTSFSSLWHNGCDNFRASVHRCHPDEIYAIMRAELKEALEQSRQAGDVPTGTVDPSGVTSNPGLMAQISGQFGQVKQMVTQAIGTAQKSVNVATMETEAQLRDLQVKFSAKTFQMAFPELAKSGEVFIASFPCSAIHGEGCVDGTLIITRNNLCFCSSSANVFNSAKDAVLSRIDAGATTTKGIAVIIPLSKIVSVVPSLALDTTEGPAFFMDLPNSKVLPTALQVYDNENHQFQFFNFNGVSAKVESILYKHIKGTPIQFAYNYIDHAWREIRLVCRSNLALPLIRPVIAEMYSFEGPLSEYATVNSNRAESSKWNGVDESSLQGSGKMEIGYIINISNYSFFSNYSYTTFYVIQYYIYIQSFVGYKGASKEPYFISESFMKYSFCRSDEELLLNPAERCGATFQSTIKLQVKAAPLLSLSASSCEEYLGESLRLGWQLHQYYASQSTPGRVRQTDGEVPQDFELPSPPLSKFERQQVKLVVAIQQLIVYFCVKVRRECFLKEQDRIASTLLEGNALTPSTSLGSAVVNLQRSILQRGVKSYVELLCHHGASPQGKDEWKAMCAAFTNGEKSPWDVAVLPLLPSSSKRRKERHRVPRVPLEALVTAIEGFKVLGWARKYSPEKHISSADIGFVIRRLLLESADRSSDKGSSQLNKLMELWETSRTAEAKSSSLCEACGLSQTHHTEVSITGSTLVSRRGAESEGTTFGATRGFHELLAMGKWGPVLQQVMGILASFGGGVDPPLGLGSATASNAKAFIKFMRSARLARSSTAQQKLTSSFWELRPIPQPYLSAAPTEAEKKMLSNPLTVGLTIHCSAQENKQLENATGTDGDSVPGCLQRLRRRLWILRLLPRHLPLSLVQFDMRRGEDRILPYLVRSPCREVIGWLLVSVCGLAGSLALTLQQRSSPPEKRLLWKDVLKATRSAVEPLLFNPPHPDYVALNDYAAAYFRSSQTLLAALYEEHVDMGGDSSRLSAAGRIADVLEESVRIFFTPPPPSFYTSSSPQKNCYSLSESAITWWHHLQQSMMHPPHAAASATKANSEDNGWLTTTSKQSLASVLRYSGTESRGPFTCVVVKKDVFQFLMQKVGCLRNYHFSLYIESLVEVAPLESLLRVFAEEINENGPPILCPETAAALITALSLHLDGAQGSEGKLDDLLKAMQRAGMEHVFFVSAHGKSMRAVSSHFKGIFVPQAIRIIGMEASPQLPDSNTAIQTETSHAWRSSEALVSCRSQRMADRYPMSALEPFFSLGKEKMNGKNSSRWSVLTASWDAPPLTVEVYTVDLGRVLQIFRDKAQSHLSSSSSSHDVPRVVAAGLPYDLWAVCKPAGVNCTQHVHHPSLISFLQRELPWTPLNEGLATFMPVVRQHGLVNRIDVGTSGLVLVARSPAALLSATAAASTHRRIQKFYRVLVRSVSRSNDAAGQPLYLPPSGVITGHVLAGGGNSQHSPGVLGRLPPSLLDQRQAVTRFRVLEFFPRHGIYYLEVSLVSGRRHQIRQHFFSIGFPLVGDIQYDTGEGSRQLFGLTRPALHAGRLHIIDLPRSSTNSDPAVALGIPQIAVVECPLPQDMENALESLRAKGTSKLPSSTSPAYDAEELGGIVPERYIYRYLRNVWPEYFTWVVHSTHQTYQQEMRKSIRLCHPALYEFVDDNFLNNKRPAIPGGAWPLEALKKKSMADLQTIWFSLVKERNMLATMKEHYLKHQEELGALPAPSRIKMVNDSMSNIKKVVKERDAEATAKATALFKERLKRGVYRYPPGPPPPPGAHDPTSVVKVILSKRVDEDRLRQLFGRYDVFEEHKGIVSLTLGLPEDVLERKKEAEQLWTQYMAEKSDVNEYFKWERLGPSLYDYSEVELVPGLTATDSLPKEGAENADLGENVIVAAKLPVPPPLREPPPPASPLERIKNERRSVLSRSLIQLGHFPNITSEKPRYQRAEDIPRPTHPDEIEGPWEACITYDRRDGLEYATSLGVKRIDGAAVLRIEEVVREPEPYAAVDEVFQEAVRHEMADEEVQMNWPHVPEWKYEYDLYSKKHMAEIARYNYSNVVDYVDREVLLTGRSVWDLPIEIDPTCGGARSVPPHAKKPTRYMNAGIASVGVTDI
eukprot:gene10666-7411_t